MAAGRLRDVIVEGSPAIRCRNCGSPLGLVFCDLGMQPLANAYLAEDQLGLPEAYYPLRPMVCEECCLVQLPRLVAPDTLFAQDYAYFSGQSEQWVEHCREFASEKDRLTGGNLLEIASNDGTLLREFARNKWQILGVEPAENVSWFAQLHGAPTLTAFFGIELAGRLRASNYAPHLVVATNVMAHVPDLDDFLGGVRIMLEPTGLVAFEFPLLGELIKGGHWDTIYHEHFSYFSVTTAVDALERRGMRVVDLKPLDVHGGSVRVTACADRAGYARQPIVDTWLQAEQDRGMTDPAYLAEFAESPAVEKVAALEALTKARRDGPIVGYGAAAKGSTFLNFCGVGPEMISAVVDSTPAKQGHYIPGAHIPIIRPEEFERTSPSSVLVLPWNWADEISAKVWKVAPDAQILHRPFA